MSKGNQHGSTMTYYILHRKLRFEEIEPYLNQGEHNFDSCAPEGSAVPAPLVALVMLLLNYVVFLITLGSLPTRLI